MVEAPFRRNAALADPRRPSERCPGNQPGRRGQTTRCGGCVVAHHNICLQRGNIQGKPKKNRTQKAIRMQGIGASTELPPEAAGAWIGIRMSGRGVAAVRSSGAGGPFKGGKFSASRTICESKSRVKARGDLEHRTGLGEVKRVKNHYSRSKTHRSGRSPLRFFSAPGLPLAVGAAGAGAGRGWESSTSPGTPARGRAGVESGLRSRRTHAQPPAGP